MHPNPVSLAMLAVADTDPRGEASTDSKLRETCVVESNGGSVDFGELEFTPASTQLGPGSWLGDVYCIERELLTW